MILLSKYYCYYSFTNIVMFKIFTSIPVLSLVLFHNNVFLKKKLLGHEKAPMSVRTEPN